MQDQKNAFKFCDYLSIYHNVIKPHFHGLHDELKMDWVVSPLKMQRKHTLVSLILSILRVVLLIPMASLHF